MESSVGLKQVELGVDVEIVLVIVMMATRRDRHQLWASFHIRRAFTFPSLPHHHFPPLPYQENPGSIIFSRSAVISLFLPGEKFWNIQKQDSPLHITMLSIISERPLLLRFSIEKEFTIFHKRSLKDLHVNHNMFSFGILTMPKKTMKSRLYGGIYSVKYRITCFVIRKSIWIQTFQLCFNLFWYK